MRTRILRRLLSGLAVAAIAIPALLVAPSAAQAHDCGGGRRVTVNAWDGVAYADVTFYPRCSDGQSHWHGTIKDTLCDARSARVLLVANEIGGPLGNAYQWSRAYNAVNGCGTTATFSGSAQYVGTYNSGRWHLDVHVFACNSTSCSRPTTYKRIAYNF